MTTRRRFLQDSLGGLTLCSLAPMVPEFLARTALGAAGAKRDGETLLVVIQLAGGNDGLNTLAPYADDRYAKARPTLRLSAREVRPIAPGLGFHAQMEAFERLYKDGLLSVLQGVGTPAPNRNHGSAMAVWQTAQLEPANVQTGWLGRALDRHAPLDATDVAALFIGQIGRPLALNAEKARVPAITSLEDAKLLGGGVNRNAPPAAGRPSGNALLDYIQQASAAGLAQSAKIDDVLRRESGRNAPYPNLLLAKNLRAIAQLIRADLGLRIFFTELGGVEPGGFDNHAGQAANHGALLGQLADSVAAFVRDLAHDRLLDRVLVMTFSEFGRTLAENGRRGTDHGAAAPLFLAGGGVRNGLLGSAPDLVELPGGGLRPTADFRRLYATVLDRWLGYPSEPILGGKFAPLDILRNPA